MDADVVVADITKLLPPNFFNLGIRDQLGRPNIYLVESLSTGYDRVLGFNCITYANNSPSRSLTTLVSAITSALKVEPHENANDGALVTPFSKPSRSQFVTRIREAADSIRLLRLNSAADTVAELEDIATELEELSEKEGARHLHETALKFLRVLSRFADQLSSVRGSRMLISGIIGVVLGGAGFSAITAYGLSLAFWEGKDAFLRAIELLNRKPSSSASKARSSKSDRKKT